MILGSLNIWFKRYGIILWCKIKQFLYLLENISQLLNTKGLIIGFYILLFNFSEYSVGCITIYYFVSQDKDLLEICWNCLFRRISTCCHSSISASTNIFLCSVYVGRPIYVEGICFCSTNLLELIENGMTTSLSLLDKLVTKCPVLNISWKFQFAGQEKKTSRNSLFYEHL